MQVGQDANQANFIIIEVLFVGRGLCMYRTLHSHPASNWREFL